MGGALSINVSDTVSRLNESLATIEWAPETIPEEFTHKLPAFYSTDAWTAAMNVAHMIVYEEEIANPVLASLAKGGDGVGAMRIRGTRADDKARQTPLEEWFLTEARALAVEPVPVLRGRLQRARQAAIEIVQSFSEDTFNARVMPL